VNVKEDIIPTWEAHLIERAAAGESVAFELLADRYRNTLENLSMRMLRNSEDAKDAVQETLVKAFRAIGDFNRERPIKPWLCRICANCCIDIVRQRKKDGESLDQHDYMLQDDSTPMEERAYGAIRRKIILESISRLPDKYRTIILMRHFRHMDLNEIAAALNKPEGTIKSLLFRARTLLRKDLEPSFS
jgi:RNA polymerase sigma-70 factor (ECF subfamily)